MPEVNYFWDEIEDNVIEEYDENGNTIVEYTTEPTLYGSVLSQDRGGQVRHYHYDGQGNTVSLTDDAGNVTDTRKYSAFGEVTESTGTTEFVYQWGAGVKRAFEPSHLYVGLGQVYSSKLGRLLSVDGNHTYDATLTNTIASDSRVPSYDANDVANCLKILKQAIAVGGWLAGYTCAAQLLKHFVYDNIKGKTICPQECAKKLESFDWAAALKDQFNSRLVPIGECDRNGSVKIGKFRGSYCIKKDQNADLYFAFHCVDWKTEDAECDWECEPAAGCCCKCNATCGATITIADDYDFCSSLKMPWPPRRLTVGETLAKCGCIIEDWYKKNGKDNTFKIECPIGIVSRIKNAFRVCYPKSAP